MDLTQLPILKEKLLTEPKAADVWDFFSHHIAKSLTFPMQCEAVASHPKLETILSHAVGAMTKNSKPANMTVAIFRIPNTPFYHGACQLPSGLISFMFFEDITAGSVAYMPHKGKGTTYSRFGTTKISDAGAKASLN